MREKLIRTLFTLLYCLTFTIGALTPFIYLHLCKSTILLANMSLPFCEKNWDYSHELCSEF
jgi:hypothetical protein